MGRYDVHIPFDFDYQPIGVDLSEDFLDELAEILRQPITSKELDDPEFEERKEKDLRYRCLVEEGIKRGWQQATSLVAERHFQNLEKLARKAVFACDDVERLKQLMTDIISFDRFIKEGEEKAEEALLALNPGKFQKGEFPHRDTLSEREIYEEERARRNEHSWEDLYGDYIYGLPEEGSDEAIIHEGVIRGWQQAVMKLVAERNPVFVNVGRLLIPDMVEPHRLERFVHILSYM